MTRPPLRPPLMGILVAGLLGAALPAQEPAAGSQEVSVEDLDAQTREALDLLVLLDDLEPQGVAREPVVDRDAVWIELPTDAETALDLVLVALAELGYAVPDASPHMLGGWFAVEDVWVQVESIPFRGNEPWARLHTRVGSLADEAERQRARIVLDMVNVIVDERVAAVEQAALEAEAAAEQQQLAALPPLPAAAGIVPVDGYGVGFDDGYEQGYGQGYDDGYASGYDGGYDAAALAQVTLPGNYYAPSIISTYASWPSWLPYYSCGGAYWSYAPLACLYPRSPYGFGFTFGLGDFALGFSSYFGPYWTPGYLWAPYRGFYGAYYGDYAYGYGYGYGGAFGFGLGYDPWDGWGGDTLIVKNVTKIEKVKKVKKVTRIVDPDVDHGGGGGGDVADAHRRRLATPREAGELVRDGDVGAVDGAGAEPGRWTSGAIRDALAAASERRTRGTPRRAELAESARERRLGSARAATDGPRTVAAAGNGGTLMGARGTDAGVARDARATGRTLASGAGASDRRAVDDASSRVRDALRSYRDGTLSVSTARADMAGRSDASGGIGSSSFTDASRTRRLSRTLLGPDRTGSSGAIVSSRTTTADREPTSSTRRSYSLGTLPVTRSTYRLGRVFTSDATSGSARSSDAGGSSRVEAIRDALDGRGPSTTISSNGVTITFGGRSDTGRDAGTSRSDAASGPVTLPGGVSSITTPSSSTRRTIFGFGFGSRSSSRAERSAPSRSSVTERPSRTRSVDTSRSSSRTPSVSRGSSSGRRVERSSPSRSRSSRKASSPSRSRSSRKASSPSRSSSRSKSSGSSRSRGRSGGRRGRGG